MSFVANGISATNCTNYHESKPFVKISEIRGKNTQSPPRITPTTTNQKHFVKISVIRGKKTPISATNATNYRESKHFVKNLNEASFGICQQNQMLNWILLRLSLSG